MMRVLPTLSDPWRPFTVVELEHVLAEAAGFWWLSGGRALDEYVGRSTRPHGDIDMTVVRGDWPEFYRSVVSRLQIWIVGGGEIRGPASTPIGVDVRNLWARVPGDASWRLQINLEIVEDGHWIYRRDPRIRRPLSSTWWTSRSVRCVMPAVQLLWKSARPEAKDERDFDTVVPLLSDDERGWLRAAVRTAHPGSPWLGRLEMWDDGSCGASQGSGS